MAETLLVALASSSVLGAGLSIYFKARVERTLQLFAMKREACLEALAQVDAVFTTLFPDSTPQSAVSAAELRLTHSRLLVTCRNREVAAAFLQCLGLQGHSATTAADIEKLRVVVRHELGLNQRWLRRAIEPDLDTSWLAVVGSRPLLQQGPEV
ncbi:hypothetical protein [Nocardioides massiliensis]|uniref:Secreted protein n=1 Tax=Nocardioides massiliensis TaxID=1325935 RepID=A0ABT9NMY8_9ACTN|nr:hypothetical protein [Nocardioides massiliensis]MDP9821784.1 hypothetical protein [Nocardioides massiliensis]